MKSKRCFWVQPPNSLKAMMNLLPMKASEETREACTSTQWCAEEAAAVEERTVKPHLLMDSHTPE